MRGNESVKFTDISADTSAFELKGGAYTLDVVATFGGGSVALERLGPDGSTWLTLESALTITAAGSSGAVALPPGSYRLNLTTASAVYATVTRVPGE